MANVRINISRFRPMLSSAGILTLEVGTFDGEILRPEATADHSPAAASMIRSMVATTYNRANIALILSDAMEDIPPLGY